MKFARIAFKDGDVKEVQYNPNKKLIDEAISTGAATVVLYEKQLPLFKFTAWVHPKVGGDDYQVTVGYEAATKEVAIAALKKYLARISDVTNDYVEV